MYVITDLLLSLVLLIILVNDIVFFVCPTHVTSNPTVFPFSFFHGSLCFWRLSFLPSPLTFSQLRVGPWTVPIKIR